jgi:hypothetical protein
MTQDEIIEMACQTFGGVIKKEERDNFIAFAKLVAEKEREACATMSDWILKEGGGTWGDAIRDRGSV